MPNAYLLSLSAVVSGMQACLPSVAVECSGGVVNPALQACSQKRITCPQLQSRSVAKLGLRSGEERSGLSLPARLIWCFLCWVTFHRDTGLSCTRPLGKGGCCSLRNARLGLYIPLSPGAHSVFMTDRLTLWSEHTNRICSMDSISTFQRLINSRMTAAEDRTLVLLLWQRRAWGLSHWAPPNTGLLTVFLRWHLLN